MEQTPAMSAATADTRDSSSYQDRSIGLPDNANDATAAATNGRAASSAQAAMLRARASNAGSNSCRCARKLSTRARRSRSK